VDERDDKFIFTVESTGSLKPEEIVFKALRVLSQKVEQVKNLI
jgi:DNA-directed RNA polymerase alpha subunit